MKLVLIFVFIAIVASSPTEEDLFDKFSSRHNIIFKSKTDFLFRKKIFNENLKKIEEQNKKFEKGEETFKEDLNEFSLFTFDEMKAMTLGEIGEPIEVGKVADDHLKRRKRDTADPPVSWSWYSRGVLRPVRHQGSCGGCYAFAAIGAIESRMQIVHGISTDLSEQEALQCTNGCSGGWDYEIYNYSTNKNGCTSNSVSPYTASSLQNCSTSSSPRIAESKVQSYFTVPSNESDIRFYLYNKGPLSAVMKVYENFYSYSSGVYSTTSGSYVGLHAVLLVGYGSENGVNYWLVKNSWGTSWGLSGYFKIKRGVNFCEIESKRVSYPEV